MQPTTPRRATSQQSDLVVHKMTVKRAVCGILWTGYTALLAIFELVLLQQTPPNPGSMVLVAVLAGLCGWYAYRIWTFRARRLVLFIIF